MTNPVLRIVLIALALWGLPLSAHADQPAIKISITEAGIYSVSSNALQTAGWDLSQTNFQNIRVTDRGVEIPAHIEIGDFNFETGTADFSVIFYATGITRSDPEFVFTNQHSYWLTEGESAGLRMETSTIPAEGLTTPSSFVTTLRLEENFRYSLTIFPSGNPDRWFWHELPNPLADPQEIHPVFETYTFSVDHLDTTQPVTVRASLQGKSALGHHTLITLNDCVVDDVQWSGQSEQVHEAQADGTCLLEGSNTLVLESRGDFEAGSNGDIIDSLFSNWFELEYARSYTTTQDFLEFTGPAGPDSYTIQVNGFIVDGENVEVYDITDPLDVKQVPGTTTGDTVALLDTAGADEQKTYLALLPAQRKTPDTIAADSPSDLKEGLHGADYLIITHETFSENIQPLAEHREAQGLRVEVVEITDIYDEFNHGMTHPGAIKDFLTHAYDHWTAPAPLYVLLVGDASTDPKNYITSGTESFIPPLWVNVLSLETPSDQQFVMLKGDDPLPEMFIGRFPVRSATQVNTLVRKILNYENSPPFNATDSRFFFLADVQPDPLGAGNFHDSSNGLYNTVIESGQSAVVLYTTQGVDNTDTVTDQLDEGPAMVTYTGHGTAHQWSLQDTLSVVSPRNDVQALLNGDRQPLIMALSCLNNYFVFPNTAENSTSLGEEFVLANGRGSIAFWSGSGLGYSSEHEVMAEAFYEKLLSGELASEEAKVILGSLTATAIMPVSEGQISEDLVNQLILLGDPALHLSLPWLAGVTGGGGDPFSGTPAGSGCFIATAAYGSPLEPQVELLREFRDRFLTTHAPGRVLTKLYYTISPPMAEWIAHHDTARTAVQIGLLPLLGTAYFLLRTALWVKILGALGLLAPLAWRLRNRRRTHV